MSVARPASRPQQTRDRTLELLRAAGVIAQVQLLGVRGYYSQMGKPGANDRGMYDDAIFLVAPECYVGFNANTDPSVFRAGEGTGAKKGIASLCPGVWNFTLGLHKGQYLALRQHGTFVVMRDGLRAAYQDQGDGFGINIHRGGVNGTSSLGCQTIVPDQYDSFISLVQAQMKKYKQDVIPYLLTENTTKGVA